MMEYRARHKWIDGGRSMREYYVPHELRRKMDSLQESQAEHILEQIEARENEARSRVERKELEIVRMDRQ